MITKKELDIINNLNKLCRRFVRNINDKFFNIEDIKIIKKKFGLSNYLYNILNDFWFNDTFLFNIKDQVTFFNITHEALTKDMLLIHSKNLLKYEMWNNRDENDNLFAFYVSKNKNEIFSEENHLVWLYIGNTAKKFKHKRRLQKYLLFKVGKLNTKTNIFKTVNYFVLFNVNTGYWTTSIYYYTLDDLFKQINQL